MDRLAFAASKGRLEAFRRGVGQDVRRRGKPDRVGAASENGSATTAAEEESRGNSRPRLNHLRSHTFRAAKQSASLEKIAVM
jgi:hypothetical protein